MLYYFRPSSSRHTVRSKAKITFLASVSISQDPEEIQLNLTGEDYCEKQRIEPFSVDVLLKVKSSITAISCKTLTNYHKRELSG